MIAGKLSRRKLLRHSALAGLGAVTTFYGPVAPQPRLGAGEPTSRS